MTPSYFLARALAAALLDGDWEVDAMVRRLRVVLGFDRSWMRTLARATRSRFAIAPAGALDQLTRWLYTRRAFAEACFVERLHVIHHATPAPEMAESRWRVPALATTRELAMWLGVERDALDRLADHGGQHYQYAWIAKPSGGRRLVEAPKPRLRAVQRCILDDIVAPITPHDAAYGFRAGRSVVAFAARHVGREVVIRVDLQAFFSSVTAGRVIAILRTAGYPDQVARTLAALCTHRTPRDVLAGSPSRDPIELGRLRTRHLPQGAPTSGALANLAAYRLDVRVAAFAAELGAVYARYADDLVLSGDRALVRAATTIVARLAAIAHDEGFALNFRKTRVMTSSGRQRITGIVVNDRPSVSRADVELLRAILHNCVRHGPVSQNRDGHADFRAHLRGRVAWIAAVDPRKGARLQAIFDAIAWP